MAVMRHRMVMSLPRIEESSHCRGTVTLRPSVVRLARPLGENLLEPEGMTTIALVDDNRKILTSVSIALEIEGYRIMTYTGGLSALDLGPLQCQQARGRRVDGSAAP